MSLKRALVFASGDFGLSDIERHQVVDGDQVICVDGGLAHCHAAGWTPDLLIGDFDSVDDALLEAYLAKGIERQRFPCSKDMSDLELALDHVATLSVEQVVLFGVSGGRTDHMLFNWWLPVQREWPFGLCLIDATVEAHVVTAKRPLLLRCPIDRLVSLLVLESVRGLTTAGLRYALSNKRIDPGSSLGLSNVVSEEQVQVTLTHGKLLALVGRATHPQA